MKLATITKDYKWPADCISVDPERLRPGFDRLCSGSPALSCKARPACEAEGTKGKGVAILD
jgi:hypothetical protein